MLPTVLSISPQTRLLTEQITTKLRTRGWLFAATKICMLLPLLYFFAPLLLASLVGTGAHDYEHAVQILLTCSASLLSSLWVVEDQRQRCPSCLHKLRSPAQVGELSRSFLSFSGVEYVCGEGHGLLHIPDFPTSWFAA
jgi:hypothetical protein